jgi:hypothetical protein
MTLVLERAVFGTRSKQIWPPVAFRTTSLPVETGSALRENDFAPRSRASERVGDVLQCPSGDYGRAQQATALCGRQSGQARPPIFTGLSGVQRMAASLPRIHASAGHRGHRVRDRPKGVHAVRRLSMRGVCRQGPESSRRRRSGSNCRPCVEQTTSQMVCDRDDLRRPSSVLAERLFR